MYEHCSCQIHIPIYHGSSNLGITEYSLLCSSEYTKIGEQFPEWKLLRIFTNKLNKLFPNWEIILVIKTCLIKKEKQETLF